MVVDGVIDIFGQNFVFPVIGHGYFNRRFDGGAGVGIGRVNTGDIGIGDRLGHNVEFAVFSGKRGVQTHKVDREGPLADIGVVAVGHGVILTAHQIHAVDLDHGLRFELGVVKGLIGHGIDGHGVGRPGGDNKADARCHALFSGGSTASIHNGNGGVIRAGGQTGHRFDFIGVVDAREIAGSRDDFGHGDGIVNGEFITVHGHGFDISRAIAVVVDGDGLFRRCITDIRFVKFHGIRREHRFAGFIDGNGSDFAGEGRFRCQITDFIQTRCQTAETLLLLFSGNFCPFPVGSAVFHLGGYAGNRFG